MCNKDDLRRQISVNSQVLENNIPFRENKRQNQVSENLQFLKEIILSTITSYFLRTGLRNAWLEDRWFLDLVENERRCRR